MEAPSLAQALDIPENTAWGYVDYLIPLMPGDAAQRAKVIATGILEQTNPPCDLSQEWTYQIQDFYEWMYLRIGKWIEENEGAEFIP